MNTLPKSLHTVSALVNVARALLEIQPAMSPTLAAVRALAILGYHPADDTHGLVDVAIRKLAK